MMHLVDLIPDSKVLEILCKEHKKVHEIALRLLDAMRAGVQLSSKEMNQMEKLLK